MNDTLLRVLSVVTLAAACGDAPANPSDVSVAGTALAIGSAATKQVEDDRSRTTVTPANNGANNGSANGPWAYELDCTASLTTSGAFSGTFQNVGCAGFAAGARDFGLAWLFGDLATLGEGITLEQVSPRSDAGTFDTEVTYLRPSEPDEQAWIGTCAVTVDTVEPYTDGNRQSRAVWTGSIDCATPLQPHSRPANVLNGEWEPVADAEGLTIESFTFETPYPFM